MTVQTSSQNPSTTPSYSLMSSEAVPLTVPSLIPSTSQPISTSQSTPSMSSLSTTSSTTLSTHSEPIWTQLTTVQTPLISLTSYGSESTANQSINSNSGPKWVSTEWSQCSVSCGNGTQNRHSICSSHLESDCDPNKRPDLEVRHCFRLCSLFQWKTFEWTECSASCGKGYKTRIIQCLDWTNSVVPNQFCDPTTKPKSIGHCKTDACPFVWETSEWSQVWVF